MTFDEEDEHCVVAMEQVCISTPPELQGKGLELVEFAAAASKTQQPCDVATSFKVLKSPVRRLILNPQLALQAPPTLLAQVEGFLTMEATSRKTLTLFLSHLLTLFGLTFMMSHLQKDWERAYRILSL